MTENSITYDRLLDWFKRRTTSSAVRRVGLLTFALSTDIGNVRKENQDRCAVLRTSDQIGKSLVVSVVCDGMGGMEAGSDCASKSIASFLHAFTNSTGAEVARRLKNAVLSANERIFTEYGGRGGATLSAVCLDDRGELIGVNVGDSRIYSVESDEPKQRSVDDTLAGHFGENNGAFTHRNELIQFVGIGEEIEPHIVPLSVSVDKDIRVLITSDGVHFMDKNLIGTIIKNAKEPAVAVQRLTELSKWCGGKDNASALMSSSYNDLMTFRDGAKFGVTEIWDPFGEIQLIAPLSQQKNIPQHEDSKKQGEEPPKKRRRRKSPPKKSVKKKSASSDKKVDEKKSEDSEPQLDIEFDESQGE